VCFHIRAYVTSVSLLTVTQQTLLSAYCQLTDYCNALLYRTSAANIAKLLRLQNTLTRAVTLTRRRDHISPVLSSLHWLPTSQRIKVKLATITYKVLATGQTDHLSSFIPCPATALFFFQPLGSHGQLNQILIKSIQPCSTKNPEFTEACKRLYPSRILGNMQNKAKTRIV